MTTAQPYYGTCLACVQPIRLLANGTLAKHQAKRAFRGSMIATVTCRGSYASFAEAKQLEWDARASQWVSTAPVAEGSAS
jgi:hypothetical protein